MCGWQAQAVVKHYPREWSAPGLITAVGEIWIIYDCGVCPNKNCIMLMPELVHTCQRRCSRKYGRNAFVQRDAPIQGHRELQMNERPFFLVPTNKLLIQLRCLISENTGDHLDAHLPQLFKSLA